MRAQYRSVEDDVEQRSVSTLGENEDERDDDDAAGKDLDLSPFSRRVCARCGGVVRFWHDCE